MSRFEAATLALVMVALGGDRLAAGRSALALPALSVQAVPAAVAPGFTLRLTRPWAKLPFGLRLSVPGRDGQEIWGASLALPSSASAWPFAPLTEKAARKDLSFRPTPELEIGFRSLGKAQGAAIQYVSPGGVRLGAGLFFNKLAPGTEPARQVMVVLQFRF